MWKWLFRKEKVLLWIAMQGHVLEVQHVGSTAIPGMIAKPIIDILAAVSDFERAFAAFDSRLVDCFGVFERGEGLNLICHFDNGLDLIGLDMANKAPLDVEVFEFFCFGNKLLGIVLSKVSMPKLVDFSY